MNSRTSTDKVYRFELKCCKCSRSNTIFAKENDISIEACKSCGYRDYSIKMVKVCLKN